MLKVEGLSKSFDGLVAVRDVDFMLNAGEIHAIIGPNGAGKTTFFDLITGHLTPDRGTVVFAGEPITHLAPHRIARKGIARSFQRVNVFPRMTVRENLQVALTARAKRHFNLMGSSQSLYAAEAEELLGLVGIGGEGSKKAGTLAYGGQKQLELAIALASRPRLLLLDEPTAGMSPGETGEAIALIERIAAERGLALLFTEHDMDVVFGIAQRISVFNHGEVIACGTAAEVRRDPQVKRIYLGGDDGA